VSFNVLDINQTTDITSVFLDHQEDDQAFYSQLLHNEHVKIRPSGKNLKWEKDGLPFDSEYELQKLKIGEQMRHGRHLLSLAEGRESTKDYRLVKKCKSPTRESRFETGLEFVNETTGEMLKPKVGRRKPIARLFESVWAGTYRIRVMAQGSTSEPPPQQAGDRETSELSQKGASKILRSGAYVSAVRGGFTTFLTLTFDAKARERIINQEQTIGKEASRFFDAMNKVHCRGWQCAGDSLKSKNGFDCIGATEIIPPKDDALDYLWVAEMPENKDGEPNPHCHVLLRWNVEPHLFHDWAKRVENLWGQGFAKLERIRSADAASGYLLKAVGYVVKGNSKEQGLFKGNRYGISKAARAPADECIAEFDAQNMCAIINEIREKLERRNKPVKSLINSMKSKLITYKKAYNIQKAKKGRTQAERNQTLGSMQKRIEKFEQTIKDSYKKLTECGAYASEYQITFNSAELVAKFIGWANEKRYWNAEALGGYLRDFEQLRQSQGQLVKAARDYWKSFGDNGEYSDLLWAQRLKAANEHYFEVPQSCGAYEEYLSITT